MNPFSFISSAKGLHWQEGIDARLEVAAETVVEGLVTLRAQASGKLVIMVGPRASVRVVLFLEAKDRLESSLEVNLGDEASCDFTFVQMLGDECEGVIRQQMTVGAGAQSHLRNIELGGKKVSHKLDSFVRGVHGRSDIDWLFYAKGKETMDLSVHNVFEASDGRGEITMKGIAEDAAHAKAQGLIEIGLGGKGTDAYLTQNVLMLDPTAKIDAVPGLEIKTNDVKASHSATVARVTPEDLYYFAARGIEKREARKMYVIGFVSQMLEGIADDELREKIVGLVEKKYDGK